MTSGQRRGMSHSGAIALLLWVACPADLARAQGPSDARPRIEQARVVGAELRLLLANPGETPTDPAELIVATRADGRLAASTRRLLAPLPPGGRREERVAISLWGAGRPELRGLLEQGCCVTRAWIAPDGPAVELVHPPASGSYP